LPRFTTRELTLAAIFTALIAGGALITVPLGAVPFTLQVLFVLLAGMLLGPRLGAMSILAYLALGLVAPVYAGGSSGLGVLFGPTGGYLWGFLPGAIAAAAVTRSRLPGLPRLVAAGLVGLIPIYGLGAVWLALQLQSPSYEVVVVGGVLQFLPLDVLKAFIAAFAARSLFSLPLGLPALPRDR